VAFLFTDIQDSTRLWQQHRAAMERTYARHDAVLRAAITEQGGVVYKVVGGAVQAAFPTAPEAVAAALEIQLGLSLQDWTGLGLLEPLRVRMALHAGAVDPDPDGDYRSPVLNRLGRLLGAGHGGQVLLSQAVQQLSRDRLPEGTGLKDLGEQRLKDLLEPERVWQLLHPALPSDFPDLATLDVRPHNLPLQPTLLVGREREVTEVVALLRRDDVRLVTLTGPGGTGKTRLALQTAAEVVDEFPGGAWFVPLAALTDPALVPSAVAEALGVRETGGTPLRELLGDYLRDKRLLLVLDNFEQVLAAAPVINQLLAGSPEVKAITTSRAPLRLRIEREYAVPPLGLPRRKPPPTAAQLSQYAAVRLFIERAQAVRSDFVVDAANAPAIAEICHRLDGLPLAIELAAARIRLFPPQAMLSRLEQRLPLLTGGARDLPLRQQTLKATIAWSYDLLSEDERRLYRRLSVFTGGWSLAAAEAVAGSPGSGDLGLDVLEGLEALAEHSLVHQMAGGMDEARFAMLETIREYGLDQLTAAGEAGEGHQRHAAYFLRLTEMAEGALQGPEQGAWLDRLEAEHDNLRAALTSALTEDPEAALRLAGAARWFWEFRSYLSEGLSWLERSLSAAPAAPAVLRAKATLGAGGLARLQGHYGRAEELLEEALAQYRSLGDGTGVAGALNTLAIIAEQQDLGRAVALYRESLALFREERNKRGQAITLQNLATCALERGDFGESTTLLEEALALFEETGNGIGVCMVLMNLGIIAARQGDPDRALALLADVLGRLLGLKDQALTSYGLQAVAEVVAQRQPKRAARLAGAGAALREAIGLALSPSDRAEYDQVVTNIGALLCDAVAAAEMKAGRALSLDEAVAEALALADELAGSELGADTGVDILLP